jgi:hypothetical protein
MWGSLSNIERLDGGTSRYVDELLANGGGSGNLYLSFTPTVSESGIETFTPTLFLGGMVAALKLSAILFITGGHWLLDTVVLLAGLFFFS